jgi:hypothetical protein
MTVTTRHSCLEPADLHTQHVAGKQVPIRLWSSCSHSQHRDNPFFSIILLPPTQVPPEMAAQCSLFSISKAYFHAAACNMGLKLICLKPCEDHRDRCIEIVCFSFVHAFLSALIICSLTVDACYEFLLLETNIDFCILVLYSCITCLWFFFNAFVLPLQASHKSESTFRLYWNPTPVVGLDCERQRQGLLRELLKRDHHCGTPDFDVKLEAQGGVQQHVPTPSGINVNTLTFKVCMKGYDYFITGVWM